MGSLKTYTVKTNVTEYYTFIINAESEQEAKDLAVASAGSIGTWTARTIRVESITEDGPALTMETDDD